MPEIEGQNFPEHEHREYPKAVYPGGNVRDGDTGQLTEPRVVSNAEEEEAAAAEGFAQVIDPSPNDAPEEAQEADAGADGSEGTGEPAPTPTEALAGLAEAEEAEDEDEADEVTTPPGAEPLPEDSAVNDGETHDTDPQDGHDDDSGRFVRGPANHGRRGKK